MDNLKKFYINGAWGDPIESTDFDVIHPGNEEVVATIAMGSAQDVDVAVAAAKQFEIRPKFFGIAAGHKVQA